MNETHDIIIEESKMKNNYMLMCTAAMLVASIAVLVIGNTDDSFIMRIIGVVGIIYSIICLVVLAGRIFASKPLLVIKEDGIIDTSSVSSIGFISFLDIDHFEMVDIMGQKAIGVVMCDTEAFIEKLPASKRNAIKSNLKLNYPPVIIRVNTAKDMEVKDVYTLLKKRNEDFSILYR